jgi:peptide/nickel transport system permease protein
MAAIAGIERPELFGSVQRRNRYLRAIRTPRGIIGLGLILLVVALGVLAPLLARFSPEDQLAGPSLASPSLTHLLGTDQLGRDLFSRVIYGIRVDVLVGVLSVSLSAIIGTALGLLSPLRPELDAALARLFDIGLAFPPLVLGLAVAAVLRPGEPAIVITAILANIPFFGRLARTAFLQQNPREYILAVRIMGGGPLRIAFGHILPNSVDTLIVQCAIAMSTAIYVEGGLSFVGIGVQPPQPSLGNILNDSLSYLTTNFNYAAGPIVAFSALMLGLYFVADALNRGLLKR